MDPGNDVIAVEVLPFIRTYRSGRVERFVVPTIVPPSPVASGGVASKDVVIDPTTGVAARLFLPVDHSGKLPVLVYFHGGGFVVESAFSATYHAFAASLASKARAVVVSVEYRLAPEHPIPAAYEDSWAALSWVASHASGRSVSHPAEPWLIEHADFGRMFVSGDSAGGNIVHNMLMRAGQAELMSSLVGLEGAVLVHPYFWGTARMPSEEGRGSDQTTLLDPAGVNAMWPLVCGGAAGNDDARVNPMAEGAPSLKGLGCRRILVVVAERDVLRDRGRAYAAEVRESGWAGEVEWWEAEGEDHVFHLFNPGSDKARVMMEKLAGFVRRE